MQYLLCMRELSDRLCFILQLDHTSLIYLTDDRNTAILSERDGTFDQFKFDSGSHYKVIGTSIQSPITSPVAAAAAAAAFGSGFNTPAAPWSHGMTVVNIYHCFGWAVLNAA